MKQDRHRSARTVLPEVFRLLEELLADLGPVYRRLAVLGEQQDQIDAEIRRASRAPRASP